MTIASQTSRISYVGDGATTVFTVPYYFSANTDLVVSVQDTAGNVVTKVLGTDYTLSGATVPAGGAVTFTIAPAIGYKIAIYRVPPITQITSYNNNDPFPAKSHELALDKLTTIGQYLKGLMDRAILVAPTDNPPTATLPPASVRANQYFFYDGAGNPSVGTPVGGSTPVSVAMKPVLAASSIASAAGLFGVFNAVADATASTISVLYNTVRLLGYATAGDGGGATYKRVGSAPSHTAKFQSADGSWWEIAESTISVMMTGADRTGVSDCVAAVQRALDVVHAWGGGTVYFPNGTYLFTLQASYANPSMKIYDNTTLLFADEALVLSQSGPGGSWAWGDDLFANADFTGASGGNKNITIRGGRFKAAGAATYPTGNITNGSYVITGLSSDAAIQVGMGVFGTGTQGGGTGGGSTKCIVTAVDHVAHTATMNLPATQTLTGQQFFIGWAGGPFFDFAHVDNLVWENSNLLDTFGPGPLAALNVLTYCGLLSSVTNFRISNITQGLEYPAYPNGGYYGGSGGINIAGGCSEGLVSNLKGRTGDDFLSINLEVGRDLSISSINVENIRGSSMWAQVIRLLVANGITSGSVSNINIKNVIGASNVGGAPANTGSCGIIMNDLSASSGRLAKVTLDGVMVDCTQSGSEGIWADHVLDLTVKCATVINPFNHYVRLDTCSRPILDDVRGITGNRNGGGVEGILATACGDIQIKNGAIASATSHGIKLSGCIDGNIVGVSSKSSAGAGIVLTDTTNISVVGNRCALNTSFGIIETGTSDYNSFASNNTRGNTAGGLSAPGAHSVSASLGNL